MLLNKFEFNDTELALDDPRFEVMKAWASYADLYTSNLDLIGRSTREVDFGEARNRTDFDYATEIEDLIEEQSPELMSAVRGLSSAIDKVRGWSISWRQAVRGEDIGTDPVVESEGLTVVNIVRGPTEYHEWSGWLIGSQIGGDRHLGGINAWVEVVDGHDDVRGIYHQLGLMYMIDLRPPITQ